MLVSADKVPLAVGVFIEEQLIPMATSFDKWLLAGAVPLVRARVADLLASPQAKLVMDDEGRVDTGKIKEFFASAFAKVEKLPVSGFVFGKSDADAFVQILERLKDG